ncbi:MAG: pyruvate, phosphate dikinase [Myxococcota bacterium]|jgi:pyruvate,orthophosphate dikinase|nr:pyruvate, phosphate dikinase [Myxococcota bacterium]
MAHQANKLVYSFGGGKAEGDATMKDNLGGKGANLAEMAKLGIPVPAGFTLSTDVCNYYHAHNHSYPPPLRKLVDDAMTRTEKVMGMKFGDAKNPLLVSVRSGARKSMPGMMETVLNVGLCSETIPGLIMKTKNPRFVYDAYRRLIMMYSDVVMEKAAGIEPAEGQGIRQQLDRMLQELKERRGCKTDADLSEAELIELCGNFKVRVKEVLGKDFPDTAVEQLWGGIGAVFSSWNGKRAISYRRIEGIPHEWGTAVNVQAMVFGNMGDTSATGVAFSRNPATGENKFYGEWLVNAQGEDVVAGIRTPNPLNEATKNDQNRELGSLEVSMPTTYHQLDAIRVKLEKHFADMQDIEFTIQEGRLWMLQCRVGKRTGTAALNIAMDMLDENLIKAHEAVMRVSPDQLDELLHPIVDPSAEAIATLLARGLPAGPGGAWGRIVFTAADAVNEAKNGPVILVREETNPEDVEGMRAASGILTARGGMTSHAALVARGWGKCCIVGCSAIEVDVHAKVLKVGGRVFSEGAELTLNGTKGNVYLGRLDMKDATENPRFVDFMKLADAVRRLKVRTNADTPEDAARARGFGAQGIGLFRTEHMFYGTNSEEPLFLLRKMIMAGNEAARRAALDELYPFVKKAIKGTLEVMGELPVTIRLLDPPLHEFVPTHREEREKLARALNVGLAELDKRAEELHETNPMMGHRGVRLGVTFPEISEMQFRAVFEAAVELVDIGVNAQPEIMVPVVGCVTELDNQKVLCDRVYDEVCRKYNVKKIDYMYGTMIEIPRAALTADEIAQTAEFFSFGTNDLTQMTFGFSRDDIGGFVPDYVGKKILPADPFQLLDRSGVGQLVGIACERGRAARPKLKLGICGEHGGEPSSVEFCHMVGLDYVSCSPFRVPIARLAAAQAAIRELRAHKALTVKGAPKAKKAPAKKTLAKKAPAKSSVKKTPAKVVKLTKKAPTKAPIKKAAAPKKAVPKKAAPKKAVPKKAGVKPLKRATPKPAPKKAAGKPVVKKAAPKKTAKKPGRK